MTLEADRLHLESPERYERPNKDFVIVALDMLSGVVGGLRTSVESLVQSNQPPLLQLVCACVQDATHEVRQSAFAFLGDLAASCFPYVEPYLPLLFDAIFANLSSEHASACNNAVWALGEIALQYGAAQHVTQCCRPLIFFRFSFCCRRPDARADPALPAHARAGAERAADDAAADAA